MTPEELVDAARQAVADWNDGRSAGPAGQALRDVVAGLLALRDKDTDHIADLVAQLDAALADRDVALRMAGAAQADRAALRVEIEAVGRELVETRDNRDRLVDEHGARLAQVAVETGRVLAERGEEIAALTAERDRAVTGVRVLDDLRMAEIRDLTADRDRQATRLQNMAATIERERDEAFGQVQRVREWAEGICRMHPHVSAEHLLASDLLDRLQLDGGAS